MEKFYQTVEELPSIVCEAVFGFKDRNRLIRSIKGIYRLK